MQISRKNALFEYNQFGFLFKRIEEDEASLAHVQLLEFRGRKANYTSSPPLVAWNRVTPARATSRRPGFPTAPRFPIPPQRNSFSYIAPTCHHPPPAFTGAALFHTVDNPRRFGVYTGTRPRMYFINLRTRPAAASRGFGVTSRSARSAVRGRTPVRTSPRAGPHPRARIYRSVIASPNALITGFIR